MAAGSPEAVLESGVIERAGRNLWMVAREPEELSLLAPVMRQVLAQPQEPRRRQWLTALEESARCQEPDRTIEVRWPLPIPRRSVMA